MTKQQFEAIFERLTPRRREVLLKFLANESDEAIANSLHITKATVRKTLEKICEQFGLKNDFPDERRSKRQDLVALFAKYKPELLGGCTSVVENEGAVSKTPNLIAPQGGEDLISLATRKLTQLGFDQKFEVVNKLRYIEYRLKTLEKVDKPYQLVLSQRQEGLYVSLPKDILGEDVVLTLFYYVNDSSCFGCGVAEITLAKLWVLPSNKDIFLESIPDNYWNILQIKGKTIGTFPINETEDDGSGYHCVVPSIAINKFIDEFRAETLSDNNSYLVLSEDRLFTDNLRVCISSSGVLQEFIEYFEKILMEK